MGNEAVYRERFENVLRVVGQVVDGAGQLFGRHLDLCRWDAGPGGGACIMGLCSLDEWFQAQGFSAGGGAPYGPGAPQFQGVHGGGAVANFLGIDKYVFEALFCAQGYYTSVQAGATPKRVRDRIAEYIGFRFEGRSCSPHLMMYLQMSEVDKQHQQPPAFLLQHSTSNPWASWVFDDTTVTLTAAPSTLNYYMGNQQIVVPKLPTSPPFSYDEVAQIMKQMAMQSAMLAGIAPPNIKPPVSMYETNNAMMADA